MKPRLALLAAGSVLATCIAFATAPVPALAVALKAGMAAPDFTVATLHGEKVSLNDYHGRVVLVIFWSSWCGRCREELVFLETMREKYPELALLALNAESDLPSAEDLVRIREAAGFWKPTVTVAIDEGLRVWARYGVNALPTSMIVGKDGTILFIEANFYWASPELIENALGSAFAVLADTLPQEIDLGGGSGGDLVPETQICRKALCLLEDLAHR